MRGYIISWIDETSDPDLSNFVQHGLEWRYLSGRDPTDKALTKKEKDAIQKFRKLWQQHEVLRSISRQELEFRPDREHPLGLKTAMDNPLFPPEKFPDGSPDVRGQELQIIGYDLHFCFQLPAST